MGNRSSSHYPPPPHWMHQRTSYSTTASPYPEAKRPIAPGAFAEPYIVHGPTNQKNGPSAQMRRSMVSLNADSGYIASTPDSDRMRHMRGSRMSLNQLDFEPMLPPRLIIPPDAKTLKKLEKMEKKHHKLMKKLGARGIPIMGPPPPPMHPMYSRAMSFDEINRIHEAEVDAVRLRPREWNERRQMPTRRETQSQYVKHGFSSSSGNRRTELGGSLASSSPMTSSEEGGHSSDPWNNSSISSGRNNNNQRDIISPPMYSSTPHNHHHNLHPSVTSPQPQPISKTIEVKVERSEKIEQTHNSHNHNSDTQNHHQNHQPEQKRSMNSTMNTNTNSNVTYAQPIIRGQPSYGSRTSSIATSQIRCDQSEIDFSWVNEEEDKLKREKKPSTDRLPEFYFGMDPPRVEEKENEEERRQRRLSVLEKTAAFEIEARRAEREKPSFLSRSSHHLASDIPQPDYSPLQVHTKESGPAERRIYRMQRQSENPPRNDDRRYRSSIAF